ncbi:CopG family transcriptional regulator [Nitrosospira sp. Nsp5]|uniref:Putative nickel-responsive regulator n=1 Tax=Nitrosospira multiformis TaxID=1231 RepID=A0ABY0THM0_9PROT|nr:MULTISPECIES: nickel-responsive transcriptional regulator NikR [Nitrosospira]PTR06100.1 CopG family transcriptional regulator [Nitrosospira sp. Nsp5]SDQ85037.1 transcriptional regulator, CopG family [Nitrosospira multiformis]
MERLTISLNDQLAEQFDVVMHNRGYFNRSEAVRDLIRDLLDTVHSEEHVEGHCIATLSYIYSHHESELASSLTAVQHDHHDLTLSTMHVHMDHDNCLEVAVLSGTIKNVKKFANHIIATRGVRHGKLHLLPVDIMQKQCIPESLPHAHSVALA